MNRLLSFVLCPLSFVLCPLSFGAAVAQGQIPRPTDAPPPLSPAESLKRVKLPPGFRLELVAAEPLVREPSGVCWDEHGRLFVCELHGYNLEGQYDIDELNKTGKLDLAVRRIPANPGAIAAAKKETYGTVKLLLDTDGDGRIDKADVFADRLPPCYGIIAARGGVIVVCAPDIVYLADRDGDGKAEVREVLFTGFHAGALERGINCPQWGLDDWIYVGRGHGGGTITGPHLKKPVSLPSTDFRIKADGSAIEPVSGATGTLGFAITEVGDRFVVSTGSPALYVPPIPWHYLARNADVATPALQVNVNPDQRVYPISEPHPWRRKRAENPGYVKFYGATETTPSGFLTSCCAPLMYQDVTLPGLRGQLLACEPAQNLVLRLDLKRDGILPKLARVQGEEKSEFLASSDPWFHPMNLHHAPDGTIWIVDFYREIIEDYSAIPRYLQQQYGLVNGKDHGRVWRLTHADAPRTPPAAMSKLTMEQLVGEVASPHLWRRETARRRLVERREKAAAPGLSRLAREAKELPAVLNVLYTLDALGELKVDDVDAALGHQHAGVRVHALRLAERWFGDRPALFGKALARAKDAEPAVVLQVALSLGESPDERVLPALAWLARAQGDQRWLPTALLSSLSLPLTLPSPPGGEGRVRGSRGGALLAELLKEPAQLGQARGLLEPLCASIAARRNAEELSEALVRVAALESPDLGKTCLRGLRNSLKGSLPVALAEPARAALKKLAGSDDAEVRTLTNALVIALKIEDPAQRQARLAQAAQEAGNVKLPVETRLAAVAQLAAEEDPAITAKLLAAVPSSTPKVREAIVEAVFSRRDRLPAVVDALEKKTLLASALTAVQRVALLEIKDAALRQRAAGLLKSVSGANEETFRRFAAGLAGKRDLLRGEKVFRDKCGTCHQAHGIGVAVGPDLTAEFQRAEETILKDILAPSDIISPGYLTYVVETTAGQVFNGILAAETANNVTLRLAEGKEQTILRRDIERFQSVPVSLMPEDLLKTLTPQDVADVISWLRSPPTRLVLLDDNQAFVDALSEGKGTATLITSDKFSGTAALRVTPPQRFAARIKGWEFRIRENPGAGEFRYLRFAWKSDGAGGVMIELANNGQWPDAKTPRFRYYAGRNTTGWEAVQVSRPVPKEWTVVTRDLWKDFGDCVLTGIAPTAMDGPALFDRIELLRTLEK